VKCSAGAVGIIPAALCVQVPGKVIAGLENVTPHAGDCLMIMHPL
jgi:hypothetical protein